MNAWRAQCKVYLLNLYSHFRHFSILKLSIVHSLRTFNTFLKNPIATSCRRNYIIIQNHSVIVPNSLRAVCVSPFCSSAAGSRYRSASASTQHPLLCHPPASQPWPRYVLFRLWGLHSSPVPRPGDSRHFRPPPRPSPSRPRPAPVAGGPRRPEGTADGRRRHRRGTEPGQSVADDDDAA